MVYLEEKTFHEYLVNEGIIIIIIKSIIFKDFQNINELITFIKSIMI